MKTPFTRHPILALGIASLALLPARMIAQPTTGFNQTAAGPFDYNNTANWVGTPAGIINGIWDASLTLAAAQTVTFSADTAPGTGLDFLYTGAQNLTLRADGTGPYTFTLGGNINVATADAGRTVTLGSTTGNQGLNINLGSAIRTFSVGGIANSSSARTLTLGNNVTNGGLLLNGGGNVNLNGNTNTLTSVRIQNSALRLNGNSAANTSTTLSGALTIDGAASSIASNTDHLGGIATITVTPNAGRNTALSAASLVRENKGVVLFRGNNLGGTLGANGVSNITFTTTAPTLTGGGGIAGTTNISILNWAVGATTAAGTANTFVTYDAVNGIRTLDTATEFQNYAADYSGVVTGTANSNTRIATGTVTLTGNNTVNSLFIGETGTSTLAGDGGTLTVTSGAVFVQGTNSTISTNLNFGTQEGIIGYMQGQATTISGGIAGSGGLTIYQAQANTSANSAGSGATFSGAATFTGDFTVNSRAAVSHSDFLAYGSRTGNVVVNGLLTLNGAGTDSRGYTMNGLYGNGRVSKAFSGSGLFRIGDNNSNGNFTGTITDGGNTVVEKIGSGTQIFSGSNAYNGATRILGGTLEVTQLANGLLNSGIGKTSNIATNLVINGGALKYTGAATSTDRLFQVGQTTTAATATLNASGSGAVNFTNTGAITYGTAGSTGTAQTRSLVLTGTNTGANTLSALIGNNGSAINGNSDVSVTKSGTGTWILAGANTYRGATTIDNGTLALGANNAFSANSAIDLNTGGTVDLKTFSTSAASLDFAAGSTLKFGLGAANNPSALLALTGALAKTGSGVFTLDFSGTGEVGTYNLVSFASTAFTSESEFTISNLGGGLSGLLTLGANSLSLTVSAVPEPSSFAFLAGAAGLLFVVGRRTRRTS